MKPLVINIACIFLLFFNTYSLANEMFFSCLTSKGVVSLYRKDNKLFYSMEKKGESVFLFFSAKKGFEEFTYNQYSRYQTDYRNVSFSNHGFEYNIFSNIDNGEIQQGVSVVNLKSNKEYSHLCEQVYIDDLVTLSNILACDKESALGCSWFYSWLNIYLLRRSG